MFCLRRAMNCQEFEYTVNDLARAQLMDAAERDRSLAHAEVCSVCAARLINEHALAAGLKALAADSENQSAPSQIEAALLAAFRQQTARAKIGVISSPTRHWQIRTWAWAAAAAVLLVVCAIAA